MRPLPPARKLASSAAAQLANNRPRPAPSDGEHGAFRQQLPDDPGAAGAYREPQRDFGTPRAGARQQQVRDVRAADEQHQRNDGHDDEQRPRQLAPQFVETARRRYELDAIELDAEAAADAIVGLVLLEERIELSSRLLY